jgi:hypothetical protein
MVLRSRTYAIVKPRTDDRRICRSSNIMNAADDSAASGTRNIMSVEQKSTTRMDSGKTVVVE